MKNTILKSERLLIKPLSINQLICIKNNMANALETPVLPGSLSDVVLSAIAKKIDRMQNVKVKFRKLYTYWLIIDKENGNGIGFVGLKGINENRYTEVGYSISPDHRKRGLMTEALRTFTEWACKNKDIKGITATVHKTNVSSVKVLENCGFELIGSSGQEVFYCIKFR